jgi:hypothetical protein
MELESHACAAAAGQSAAAFQAASKEMETSGALALCAYLQRPDLQYDSGIAVRPESPAMKEMGI